MRAVPQETKTWRTNGGLTIHRTMRPLGARQAADDPSADSMDLLIEGLDSRHGMVLESRTTQPGRYQPRIVGFIDPPLAITAAGPVVMISALNRRGNGLLDILDAGLRVHPDVDPPIRSAHTMTVMARGVPAGQQESAEALRSGPEELRTRRPSAFTVLRAVMALFAATEDAYLGLYGAFGFDIALDFLDIRKAKARSITHRDMVLYLPDRLLLREGDDTAPMIEISYEVEGTVVSGSRISSGGPEVSTKVTGTRGLPRQGTDSVWQPGGRTLGVSDDMPAGAYADLVQLAKARFKTGDLFEVVPSRLIRRINTVRPSVLFQRLRDKDPAPYGLLANLGGGDHLVGASPEMYVRVVGRRVETCPISGTIARGQDALEDAQNIRALLCSEKDESELTMCTDVDRNDKARICVPGSVRVIGRRMIEPYARLIHTVDHVEGTLAEDRDALDAFLTHCWAVTVTGAPKRDALSFIEAVEPDPRSWYGGAVGALYFNGDMDTAITLRTMRLRNGLAEIRVGATLLADSDPVAEEAETGLKAAALLDVLTSSSKENPLPSGPDSSTSLAMPALVGSASSTGLKVLMVDHEDSFVINLSAHFAASGANVSTWSWREAPKILMQDPPGLLVLSPGPGRPDRFSCHALLQRAEQLRVPVFGVCLGLQAIVEYCGGELEEMPEPAHGKPGQVMVHDPKDPLFLGLPTRFQVGRYHSLRARAASVPSNLSVSATLGLDNSIMAVRRTDAPWSAVQFHPESVMSAGQDTGPLILDRVLAEAAQVRTS